MVDIDARAKATQKLRAKYEYERSQELEYNSRMRAAREEYAKAYAKGYAEGVKIGKEKLGKLIQILLNAGEYDKVMLAASNSAEREKLYIQYGIE